MSRHFHGTQHFRGGFDPDESTIPPDAPYWRDGAISARRRLDKSVGIEKADEILDALNVFDDEHTWKEICEAVEKAAKEACPHNEGHYTVGRKLYCIACGNLFDPRTPPEQRAAMFGSTGLGGFRSSPVYGGDVESGMVFD